MIHNDILIKFDALDEAIGNSAALTADHALRFRAALRPLRDEVMSALRDDLMKTNPEDAKALYGTGSGPAGGLLPSGYDPFAAHRESMRQERQGAPGGYLPVRRASA